MSRLRQPARRSGWTWPGTGPEVGRRRAIAAAQAGGDDEREPEQREAREQRRGLAGAHVLEGDLDRGDDEHRVDERPRRAQRRSTRRDGEGDGGEGEHRRADGGHRLARRPGSADADRREDPAGADDREAERQAAGDSLPNAISAPHPDGGRQYGGRQDDPAGGVLDRAPDRWQLA